MVSLSEEKGKNTSLEIMGEMPVDMGELLFQLSGMRFALSKIMIEYAPAPDHRTIWFWGNLFPHLTFSESYVY